MASKSSSPGPNPTTTPAAKQTRSRKATVSNTDTGRAGSAGGIVLEEEKEKVAKPKPKSASTTVSQASRPQDSAADCQLSTKTARRKPRKLNKDPVSMGPTPAQPTTATIKSPVEPPTATEIEALKSRVRGLEAKVEELYKNGTIDRSGRSPRRRGKGRKNSSQQQVPTLGGSSTQAYVDNDETIEEIGHGNGDAMDELVRLEGELKVARRDLDAVRPRRRNTTTTNDTDDIEEVPREDQNTSTLGNRHVTLSGSYRIPLPSSVSVDDVRQIQSGVSAAQNVARTFLEQRRATAVKNQSQSTSSQSQSQSSKKTAKPTAASRPSPKSVSSSLEITPVDDGAKKSWGEWIGGYSLAISRAVQSIEHEAAVESERTGDGGHGVGGPARGGASKAKRPGVKTKLSGEQVDGLMS